MEHLILKVLVFDMSAPTILRFATKYCQVSDSSEKVKHLTQVIINADYLIQFLKNLSQ